MNIWESTVLTDKGADLQAKLVDGQTLQITKVMTGALKVPVVNLRQQTSVTEGGKRINLQEARTEGDKMILPVFLENTNLEEGYDLWQVGIYAQDPEEGEILYCIAQTSAAKHIPSASESPGFSITWDFCFKTSNTSPFEVAVNSVGLVNIEQFQVHAGEINHLKSSIVNLDGRIEDLNSALEWKLHDVQKSDTGFYALPNNYSEIRFRVVVRIHDIVYEYSNNYLKQELFSAADGLDRLLFLGGHYFDSTETGGCDLYFSSKYNAIKLNAFSINGVIYNNSNDCEFIIYYR